MTDKYKPFNLERALAGDKFARKSDLKEPQEWHYFKTDSGMRPFICVFDGTVCWFSISGKGWDLQDISDLVMLPKTKKLWIAVGKEVFGNRWDTSYAYLSRQDCEGGISKEYKECSHFIEIEIEVDE